MDEILSSFCMTSPTLVSVTRNGELFTEFKDYCAMDFSEQ